MEPKENVNQNKPKLKGFGFAVFLIYIGVVFMLLNLGFISMDLKGILISWQMLLIGIGLSMLFNKKISGGIILIAIGTIFMQSKLCETYPNTPFCIFGTDIHSLLLMYWPVALIVFGLLIVLGTITSPAGKKTVFCNSPKNKKHCLCESQTGADYIDRNLVFSGAKQIILSQNFKGGEANVMFAGLEIDLRKAQLAPEGASLELNMLFGGITIYVPAHWMIDIQSDILFGGFEDHRNLPDKIIEMDAPVLVIKAKCAFGGGEIKN